MASRIHSAQGGGYVLLYLIRGSLPWQGLKAENKKEKYDKIRDVKNSTTIETLCKGLPEAFSTYIDYCRKLKFEDTPDYSYLRRLFKNVFAQQEYKLDYVYDWTILKRKERIAELTNPIVASGKLGNL